MLILFTVAGLVCCPGLVRQGGGGVFAALLVFGAVINALMLAACLLSMFRPRITKRIGGALIRLLGRLRLVKDPEKKTVDFAMSLAEYQEAAAHVKAHNAFCWYWCSVWPFSLFPILFICRLGSSKWD